MNSSSDFIQWIGANPWLSILSFVITLCSLILAIVFYFKSRRTKKPCYLTRSANLVRDLVSKFESLEMLYAGQKIQNVTATKILFWNAGSDTIHNHDIASSDPVTLKISEDYRILNAQILSSKNPANKFSLEPIDNGKYYLIDLSILISMKGLSFKSYIQGNQGWI